MNVLSLFDGMSCGQIALNRAGISYQNYFASEIDKHAIKVTQHNYPKTKQLGSVTGIHAHALPKIDLLIGGSPCQGFSSAGKGLNFEDPRSALFFEYVRLLDECKPIYFLLENVNMRQEWQDVISSFLGVAPVFINSRLVSAQDRKRLYWTNIPDILQPEDKGILFEHIRETESGYSAAMRGRRINERGVRDDYNKSIPIRQYIECRMDGKTNCLTTVGKDIVVSEEFKPRSYYKETGYRYLTRREMERLQTVPDGYTDTVSVSQANRMLGNGWTVDMISHLFNSIPRAQQLPLLNQLELFAA
jgi:site-specific DNA-cytosine methylase